MVNFKTQTRYLVRMYVYEGFDDAKIKTTQVLFQVQIKTKKTKIKKKAKS